MSSRLEDALTERVGKHAAADLESVLSTEAGRRFVCSLVFDVAHWGWRCSDPAIREGSCAAQHAAFVDGMQEVGRRVAFEARAHCRHLWRQLERERLARDELDEQAQQQREKNNVE
jgi:hypothetical protein